ncbi:MAG: murein transglycosylase A [Marinicaulis sp.]|nr:murein transglycosylase A [Marinicaulis sp.]
MPMNSRNIRFVLFGIAITFAVFAIFYVLNRTKEPEFGDDAFLAPVIAIELTAFENITGWGDDALEEALPAFLNSCTVLGKRDPDEPANRNENLGEILKGKTLSGRVQDWLAPCDAAEALTEVSGKSARSFFESNFQPVHILAQRTPKPDGPAKNEPTRTSKKGKFTGYFEPSYPASRNKTDEFDTPLFARPENLVDVDLGAFRKDLSGERIAGRLEGNKLVPYPDRTKINEGEIGDVAEVLAWLNPNDLFFLQIQGSGRIEFSDGAVKRVGYAGQNGHKYTAIGRTLVERNVMPVKDVSMQSIREWLDNASHSDARELREENASYVFFQALDHLDANDGPLGAQGVPLTPLRSLAVDRRYHMLGAPIWVSIDSADDDADAIRKLMIAQDTGGAIRGPVRGDFFWGAGADAAARAGEMNAEGEMIVFLPKGLAAKLTGSETPAP